MTQGFFIELSMLVIVLGVGAICAMFIHKFDTDGGAINFILALAMLGLLSVIGCLYQAIPR